MTTTLRVIDTGVMPARWNIAVTCALTELHRMGAIPDTLRFHRYPRSVLLGRHQIVDREIDAGRCRASGVEIARRVTGGGAVYMSPAIVAWDMVSGRHRFGPRLADASERICGTFAAGINSLGLVCRFNPPGDIVVDGRKVSGSSGGFEGNTLILQGTIVLDIDRIEMAQLLKTQPGRERPAVRVASLAECLGRVPSVDEVQSAILVEIASAWRVEIVGGGLGADELTLAEKLLADEIGTEEFVAGQDAESIDHRVQA